MESISDRRPLAGLSHVSGVATEPLWEFTIPQVLARAVAQWPSNEAAVFCSQGLRRSYRDFARDVDDLALGLLGLGIGRGDARVEWHR